MISSLANFLMLVMYHGSYPQRVAWTLLMYTMGSVATARIAIEKDRAYALGYAGALGLATFIAMMRFVDSPLFSLFILIVIPYLADRIVHDCTLIDESVDASGQGLIDSGRLFVKTQLDAAKTSEEPRDGHVDGEGAASDGAKSETAKRTRKKPGGQPGRTVMYLALAALPLFGLGQFFLRQDGATWSRALWLLAVYLFASLSLLVTTSFLGLRRYLRQRHVDMPRDVSIAWLSGGVAMIAVILTLAYLAPLPGRALAAFELPNVLDSPDGLESSKYGWGDEAAERKSENAATTSQDPQQQDKDVQSIRSESGAPPGAADRGKRDDGPAGSDSGGKKSGGGGGDQKGSGEKQESDQSSSSKDGGSRQKDSSNNQSDRGERQQGQSESSKQGEESNQGQESGQSDSGKPQESGESSTDGPQSEATSQQDGRQGDEQSGDEQGKDQEQGQDRDTAAEREPDPTDPSGDQASADSQSADANDADSDGAASGDEAGASSSGVSDLLSGVIPAISGLVRLIILIVLAGIVGVYLWRMWPQIAAWWAALFAGRDAQSAETFDEFIERETSVPPRSFATYQNPFDTEQDPRRIVVITFQAFEAWTREQGESRGRDETPSEFIRRITRSLPQVSAAASQVVEAYNRIVYGRGNASDRDLSAAKKVWLSMRSS